MENETLTIKITRRDKIYISIIAVLLVAILVLAICLPRPYKILEVEKPVVVEQKLNVYPTERAYVIEPSSALYDDINQNYILSGKEYKKTQTFEYVDLNDFESARVSVMGITLNLSEELTYQLVQKQTSHIETKIVVSSDLMSAINSLLKAQNLYCAWNDEFLFEITFENVKINILTYYIF